MLTSLAAWVGAALLAFLTARRVAPRAGNLAGFIAAMLVLASPAFHAFATDIMLESPGACLSLAVVYAYVRARQEPSPGNYRWFALAMTALFLLKCNYWMLALFALTATELCRWAGPLVQLGLSANRATGVRAWSVAQLRHPLTYLLAVPLLLLAVYRIRGPFTLPLGLHIGSADTLADVAYWLAFIRVFTGWLRVGRQWLGARSAWAVTLVNWHFWPTAAWFLLPKRVALFVWYLAGNHGTGEAVGWTARLTAYSRTLARDYAPGVTGLVLVASLALAAFLLARRLRPGAAFLLWFIAMSAGLTMMQPACHGRFLHSWVAATWVAAGVGLATSLYGWRAGQLQRLRHVVAVLVIGVLAVLAGPRALGPGHATEGGTDAAHRCVLPVAEELWPRLDGVRRVAILSTNALRFFACWTYEEHCRRTERVLGEVHQLPDEPDEFAPWADRTKCDAVVWIEAAPDSLLFFPNCDPAADRVPAADGRGRRGFTLAGRCAWPELGCTAVIWRRTTSLAGR